MSKTTGLSSGKWLFFMDTTTSIEDFFANIHIPFNSEFLVAQDASGVDSKYLVVTLTEVYRVRATLPLQQHRVANWSSVSGIKWTTAHLYDRRDLQGITIKCVFVPEVCRCL